MYFAIFSANVIHCQFYIKQQFHVEGLFTTLSEYMPGKAKSFSYQSKQEGVVKVSYLAVKWTSIFWLAQLQEIYKKSTTGWLYFQDPG